MMSVGGIFNKDDDVCGLMYVECGFDVEFGVIFRFVNLLSRENIAS